MYVPEPLAQAPALRRVVQEYAHEGAVRPLDPEKAATTRYWVPVFGEPKKDGGLRLIRNLRRLNRCFPTDRFKMDNRETLRMALKNPALQWGLTLDLKSWFHHLQIHSSSRRWMRFKLRTGEAFEIEALPFVLSCSPYWAHRLSKAIWCWDRNTLQDVTVIWYVDDIAILGKTQKDVKWAAARLTEFLTDLGVQVNAAKSMRRAATTIDYLGQVINLTTATVTPPSIEVREGIIMAKEQAKLRTCVPRHLARLAGVLLDLQKGAQNLLGLLKLLMKETAHVAKTNRASAKSLRQAWSTSGMKRPATNGIINDAIKALTGLIPVTARPQPDPAYVLETEAKRRRLGSVHLPAEAEEPPGTADPRGGTKVDT